MVRLAHIRAKTPNATCCQSVWYISLSERRKFRSIKIKYKKRKTFVIRLVFFFGFIYLLSNEQRALSSSTIVERIVYLGSNGNQSQRSIDDSVCILCKERHQFNIISDQIQNKRPPDTIGIDTERGWIKKKNRHKNREKRKTLNFCLTANNCCLMETHRKVSDNGIG